MSSVWTDDTAGSYFCRDQTPEWARDWYSAYDRGLEINPPVPSELDRTEVQRLNGIAAALDAQKSAKLAARVRDYLGERFKTTPSSSPSNDGGGH